MLFRKKKEPIVQEFLRKHPGSMMITDTYMAIWSKKAKAMVMKFGDFRGLDVKEAFEILKAENPKYL